MQVYRAVSAFPPTGDDFKSQRELGPDKTFLGTTECHARALSTWATPEQCALLLKTKPFRGLRVVRVALTSDAGAIQPRSNGHVAWWHCKAFDPIAASSEVSE